MTFFFPALCSILVFIPVTYSARVENTHLVTMTKAELLEIVDCISKSKSQALCDRLAVCNNKMPEQVKKAYEKCNLEVNPNGQWKCNEKEQLYPSAEIPKKIFDCIVGSTYKLNAAESKKMVEFETCSREIYVGGCKVPKRHI